MARSRRASSVCKGRGSGSLCPVSTQARCASVSMAPGRAVRRERRHGVVSGAPDLDQFARGEAVLRFENGEPIPLKAGDHLLIPARQKHRVESTSADALWLALHFKG